MKRSKSFSNFDNSFVLLSVLKLALIAMLFAGAVPRIAGAQGELIKEYSSDNRLLSRVSTVSVLKNGLVIHKWEWNEKATTLNSKYGASKEDGGYLPAGLIAQDVQSKYPDAVISDEDGFLRIDLPVLMEQDELIANMVLSGKAAIIAGNVLADGFLIDCFTSDC